MLFGEKSLDMLSMFVLYFSIFKAHAASRTISTVIITGEEKGYEKKHSTIDETTY